MNWLHFFPKYLNEKCLIREKTFSCPQAIHRRETCPHPLISRLSPTFPAWHRDFSAGTLSSASRFQWSQKISNFPPTLQIPGRVHRSQPRAPFPPPAPYGAHMLVLMSLRNPRTFFVLKSHSSAPYSCVPSGKSFSGLLRKKHSGKFVTQPAEPVPFPKSFPKSYVHSKEVLLI